MTNSNPFIQDQIDILHDLRQEGDSSFRATRPQIIALILAFEPVVGKENRVPAMRRLCEYGDGFISSNQLSLADANALIHWLYGKDVTLGPGTHLRDVAHDTLLQLKDQIEEDSWESVEM